MRWCGISVSWHVPRQLMSHGGTQLNRCNSPSHVRYIVDLCHWIQSHAGPVILPNTYCNWFYYWIVTVARRCLILQNVGQLQFVVLVETCGLCDWSKKAKLLILIKSVQFCYCAPTLFLFTSYHVYWMVINLNINVHIWRVKVFLKLTHDTVR